MNKKNIFKISAFSVLLIFVLFVLIDQLTLSRKVVGLQVVTSKGTILLGTEKKILGNNSENPQFKVWFSPHYGWFDKRGKGEFYKVQTKEEQKKGDKWEAAWEWNELKKVNQSVNSISGMLADNKSQVIETLKNMCFENKTIDPSCSWRIGHYLAVEAITSKYICLSESHNEFYGGAHPLSRRYLKVLSQKDNSVVTFKDLIPDKEQREQLLFKLYDKLSLGFSTQEELIEEDDNKNFMLTLGQELSPEMQIDDIETELKNLIENEGYTFNISTACPVVRADGAFLLFGFSHEDQANKGMLYKVEVPLKDFEDLPSELINLYSDKSYIDSPDSIWTKVTSPDRQWVISQHLDELEIEYRKSLKTEPVKLRLKLEQDYSDLSEGFLGFFWIHRSPSLSHMQEFSFNDYQLAKGQKVIKISDLIKPISRRQ